MQKEKIEFTDNAVWSKRNKHSKKYERFGEIIRYLTSNELAQLLMMSTM